MANVKRLTGEYTILANSSKVFTFWWPADSDLDKAYFDVSITPKFDFIHTEITPLIEVKRERSSRPLRTVFGDFVGIQQILILTLQNDNDFSVSFLAAHHPRSGLRVAGYFLAASRTSEVRTDLKVAEAERLPGSPAKLTDASIRQLAHDDLAFCLEMVGGLGSQLLCQMNDLPAKFQVLDPRHGIDYRCALAGGGERAGSSDLGRFDASHVG
jgi:hypothetical protein